MGFIFECMCIRDLKAYSQGLGSREIEEGAAHLLEIRRLVKESNISEKQAHMREPDLLIVLTGGELAYRREDGVYVIPIGCLKD